MKEENTRPEMNLEIRWLTIKDVVLYSSFSERTIRRAIFAGELKSTKIRSKYLLRKTWVDRWLLNLGNRTLKVEHKALVDL